MWEPLRSTVRKTAVAVASFVTREADREPGEEGSIRERVRQRFNGMSFDASARLALSLSAQSLARWGARTLPNRGLGRLARGLASRPLAAAGVALFAFDAARDGVRLSRGGISGREFVERSSGNALGIASSAGGAVVGGAIGGVVVPVVGAPIGSVLGGMVGGIGGDAVGRGLARTVVGKPRS